MQRSALACLLREKRVLLAIKNDGTYKGCRAAYGGKVEPSEKVKTAVVREVKEESKLVLREDDLYLSAIITTLFNNKPRFEMHIFTAWQWKEDPQSTAEMRDPRWFAFDRLPMRQLIPADRIWMPRVLQGEMFNADIHVDKIDTALPHTVYRKIIDRYHPYHGPA